MHNLSTVLVDCSDVGVDAYAGTVLEHGGEMLPTKEKERLSKENEPARAGVTLTGQGTTRRNEACYGKWWLSYRELLNVFGEKSKPLYSPTSATGYIKVWPVQYNKVESARDAQSHSAPEPESAASSIGGPQRARRLNVAEIDFWRSEQSYIMLLVVWDKLSKDSSLCWGSDVLGLHNVMKLLECCEANDLSTQVGEEMSLTDVPTVMNFTALCEEGIERDTNIYVVVYHGRSSNTENKEKALLQARNLFIRLKSVPQKAMVSPSQFLGLVSGSAASFCMYGRALGHCPRCGVEIKTLQSCEDVDLAVRYRGSDRCCFSGESNGSRIAVPKINNLLQFSRCEARTEMSQKWLNVRAVSPRIVAAAIAAEFPNVAALGVSPRGIQRPSVCENGGVRRASQKGASPSCERRKAGTKQNFLCQGGRITGPPRQSVQELVTHLCARTKRPCYRSENDFQSSVSPSSCECVVNTPSSTEQPVEAQNKNGSRSVIERNSAKDAVATQSSPCVVPKNDSNLSKRSLFSLESLSNFVTLGANKAPTLQSRLTGRTLSQVNGLVYHESCNGSGEEVSSSGLELRQLLPCPPPRLLAHEGTCGLSPPTTVESRTSCSSRRDSQRCPSSDGEDGSPSPCSSVSVLSGSRSERRSRQTFLSSSSSSSSSFSSSASSFSSSLSSPFVSSLVPLPESSGPPEAPVSSSNRSTGIPKVALPVQRNAERPCFNLALGKLKGAAARPRLIPGLNLRGIVQQPEAHHSQHPSSAGRFPEADGDENHSKRVSLRSKAARGGTGGSYRSSAESVSQEDLSSVTQDSADSETYSGRHSMSETRKGPPLGHVRGATVEDAGWNVFQTQEDLSSDAVLREACERLKESVNNGCKPYASSASDTSGDSEGLSPRELLLEKYRRVCSEVVPRSRLFIGSAVVAQDLRALRTAKITHIINVAGDTCANSFPQEFKYLRLILEDQRSSSEELSAILPCLLRYIHQVLEESRSHRVLIHCREGVSRSAAVIVAYLMWRCNMDFSTALDLLRKYRETCNPNTGFTFVLLRFRKLLFTNTQSREGSYPEEADIFSRVPPLSSTGLPSSFACFSEKCFTSLSGSETAPLCVPQEGYVPLGFPERERRLLRLTPHHSEAPFLVHLGVSLFEPSCGQWMPPVTRLDPRFAYILRNDYEVFFWKGSKANYLPLLEAVFAMDYVGNLEIFEGSEVHEWSITRVEEGYEPMRFWDLLSNAGNNGIKPCEVLVDEKLDKAYSIFKESRVYNFWEYCRLQHDAIPAVREVDLREATTMALQTQSSPASGEIAPADMRLYGKHNPELKKANEPFVETEVSRLSECGYRINLTGHVVDTHEGPVLQTVLHKNSPQRNTQFCRRRFSVAPSYTSANICNQNFVDFSADSEEDDIEYGGPHEGIEEHSGSQGLPCVFQVTAAASVCSRESFSSTPLCSPLSSKKNGRGENQDTMVQFVTSPGHLNTGGVCEALTLRSFNGDECAIHANQDSERESSECCSVPPSPTFRMAGPQRLPTEPLSVFEGGLRLKEPSPPFSGLQLALPLSKLTNSMGCLGQLPNGSGASQRCCAETAVITTGIQSVRVREGDVDLEPDMPYLYVYPNFHQPMDVFDAEDLLTEGFCVIAQYGPKPLLEMLGRATPPCSSLVVSNTGEGYSQSKPQKDTSKSVSPLREVVGQAVECASLPLESPASPVTLSGRMSVAFQERWGSGNERHRRSVSSSQSGPLSMRLTLLPVESVEPLHGSSCNDEVGGRSARDGIARSIEIIPEGSCVHIRRQRRRGLLPTLTERNADDILKEKSGALVNQGSYFSHRSFIGEGETAEGSEEEHSCLSQGRSYSGLYRGVPEIEEVEIVAAVTPTILWVWRGREWTLRRGSSTTERPSSPKSHATVGVPNDEDILEEFKNLHGILPGDSDLIVHWELEGEESDHFQKLLWLN